MEDGFDFQLQVLMNELNHINQAIDRIDHMTQTCKNWAITLWSGIVAFLIQSPYGFRQYIIYTAIIPLLFWFIDGWWRHIQRTMIFRTKKIAEFLNGNDLFESFKQRKMVNFKVIDIRGYQYIRTSDYKNYASIGKTLFFEEVFIFYYGLTIFSIIIGLFLISTTK